MQTYKIFDRVFRCEFRLFIGELEDFKAAIRKMDGYPGDDELTPRPGLDRRPRKRNRRLAAGIQHGQSAKYRDAGP